MITKRPTPDKVIDLYPRHRSDEAWLMPVMLFLAGVASGLALANFLTL